MELTIDSPVQYVPKVGPAMAKRLERLGIHTVSDLLYHTPHRYNDFRKMVAMKDTRAGQTVTVQGTVTSIASVATKTGKKMQLVRIADDTGSIEAIFFHQPYLLSILPKGTHVAMAGALSFFGKKTVLVNPEFETGQSDSQSLHMGRLVPVYHETQGVTSKWLRGRMDYLLNLHLDLGEDIIPDDIRKKYALLSITAALSKIHFPDKHEDISASRKRLSFAELFALQLIIQSSKIQWRNITNSCRMATRRHITESFIARLPFTLTCDQKLAIEEITDDLEKPYPMNRLLIGDVGAGKTIVAAVAMHIAAQSGYTSLLMAPTQILAQQHFESLTQLFTPLGIGITLITAKGEKGLSTEKPQIIVGTHALLSDSRVYDNVGLIVVDEQQRFGVAQRSKLKEKSRGSAVPHILTMTATPIPRTIALTVWDSLDVSVIRELPTGRKQVKTWVVPSSKREAAYKWISGHIDEKKTQVFIVCPLVEGGDGEENSVKSVKNEYTRLKETVFSKYSVSLLYGSMSEKKKTDVLSAFAGGSSDILVTTPVVEVGIDIPNASIILIEDADRFGLSQLHQLRGRVGRRNQQAYCLLFSENSNTETLRRLKSLETIFSGPDLAELDLAMRGPGDFLGTKQHGLPNLRFADFTDKTMLGETKEAAMRVVGIDGSMHEYPHLRDAVYSGKIRIIQE